jgi:hypothetical protein
MIGSTFTTVDVSTVFGGFSDLPDATAHVVTLQLQNQDNFGSQYGFKGTLYDHKLLLRNSVESPKAGSPIIERHNAEYQLTLRETISAGVVTPAVPYVVSVTIRHPRTGVIGTSNLLAGNVLGAIMTASGARILKLLNFES